MDWERNLTSFPGGAITGERLHMENMLSSPSCKKDSLHRGKKYSDYRPPLKEHYLRPIILHFLVPCDHGPPEHLHTDMLHMDMLPSRCSLHQGVSYTECRPLLNDFHLRPDIMHFPAPLDHGPTMPTDRRFIMSRNLAPADCANRHLVSGDSNKQPDVTCTSLSATALLTAPHHSKAEVGAEGWMRTAVSAIQKCARLSATPAAVMLSSSQQILVELSLKGSMLSYVCAGEATSQAVCAGENAQGESASQRMVSAEDTTQQVPIGARTTQVPGTVATTQVVCAGVCAGEATSQAVCAGENAQG